MDIASFEFPRWRRVSSRFLASGYMPSVSMTAKILGVAKPKALLPTLSAPGVGFNLFNPIISTAMSY